MNFQPAQERLQKLQWRAAIVAVIAGAACWLGAYVSGAQLWRSYLLSFLFWWQLGLGCLGLTIVHHLVGGKWGYATRPLLTAGACTVPLLALLYVPLALKTQSLYVWAQPAVAAADEAVRHKQAYLNLDAFQHRAIGYFALWVLAAIVFCRPSVSRAGDDSPPAVNGAVSGVALLLLALTVSFAAFDWSMSLEPDWYSSIYGGLIGIGGMLSAIALVALSVAGFEGAGTFDDERAHRVLNDLGSLMLAFLMLWAYFSFSQFLIIWSGNLPAETVWYVERLRGGWEWIAVAIVVFHLFVPFLLLMSADRRRNPVAMVRLALLVLTIHLVNLFWHVAPVFHGSLMLHWLDVAAALAIGGMWVFVFSWQARRRLALVTP